LQADDEATGAIEAIQSATLKAGIAKNAIVVLASNCRNDGIIHITTAPTTWSIPRYKCCFLVW